MDSKREDLLLRNLLRETPPVVVVGSSRGPAPIDPSYTVIGMSGSTDYLRDSTGKQRFWTVTVLPNESAPADGQTCDGLHDEGAPAQYLCSRCFPDLQGDLAEIADDHYEDVRRDENDETE